MNMTMNSFTNPSSFTLAFIGLLCCLPLSSQAAEKKEQKVVRVPGGVQHAAWDRLLKKYVDTRGLVAYEAWRNNAADRAALRHYLDQFARSGPSAKGNDIAASLTNAYNAFVIHWILENYPVESIWQSKKPFSVRRQRVGGEMISLEDIEKGTLVPAIGWKTHSVLVCAARSCPPLQRSAYTAANFDAQVDTAYRAWLARPDLNEFVPAKNKAGVSSIFKWYKKDFDKAGGVKPILVRYATPQDRSFVAHGDYELKYKSYHWGLNDQGSHGRHYGKVQMLLDTLLR